jgi:hypothetical protein
MRTIRHTSVHTLCADDMALPKGKHELCEKPFVANEEEVQELFALARIQGLTLMEALKAVFTPSTSGREMAGRQTYRHALIRSSADFIKKGPVKVP